MKTFENFNAGFEISGAGVVDAKTEIRDEKY